MEVLLRKASTLAKACAQTASKIDVNVLLKLSPHTHATSSDHDNFLRNASTVVSTHIKQVRELYHTQAKIRKLIGIANNDTVSPLLAERDYLNSCEKMLSNILDSLDKGSEARRAVYGETNVRVDHDATLLQATLQSLSNRSQSFNETMPSVEVSALAPDVVIYWKDELAAIRRRRSDLMDDLAAANLNKTIILSNDITSVLRLHQIIA